VGRNREEEKAVKGGQLASIEDGPEPLWRMHPEVSDRHFTAGEKGSEASEEAYGNQDS
jgi:hypothetical protein